MPGTTASSADVRAAIARSWLGARDAELLGSVVLRPHQRSAAHRLRALIGASRGALLADAVGLGKTYTALAVARHAASVLVVAPAALRDMWREACTAAARPARFVSYHALSRGRIPDAADFVIVDESHHTRNPATRRYRALAALCRRSPVLFLSATPVHNRADDLRAQLALFLGSHAWAMADDELARFVVRRDFAADDAGPTLPHAGAVRWLDTGEDATMLAGIERLPPPLPIREAGDGGALVAISLLRQWASSRAALVAALRRRLALASALGDALRAGRHPTRQELRAWSYADGSLQLAFPEFASDALPTEVDTLLAGTERHASHVAALMRAAATGPDPDDARAAVVRRVRTEHPGERLIVFAEFAETVRALYARLARDGGVAMLTERGAVVAGGRVTRRALLAQFAPGGAAHVPAAERVALLITTDLLSEGVNLQDASVVVHADLPWSPARFEQRVGRVRRLGSSHAEVSVYALRPPAPAEVLLRMEHRLRAKLAVAARTVGIRGTIMPRLFPAEPPASSATRIHAEIAGQLARWHLPCGRPPSGEPLVGAVHAARPGFLALVGCDGRPELIAGLGAGVSESPRDVLDALRLAEGPDVPVDARSVREALAAIACWRAERASFGVLGLGAGAAARTRRRLLHRIDAIAARSPRHLRSRYVPLALQARRVATERLGAGAERVLQELADARMPDEAWLNAVRTFAELNGTAGGPEMVSAVVVFMKYKKR